MLTCSITVLTHAVTMLTCERGGTGERRPEPEVRPLQQPRRQRAVEGPQGVLHVPQLQVRQVPTGRTSTDDHGPAGRVETTTGPRPTSSAAAAPATDGDDDVETTQVNVTER